MPTAIEPRTIYERGWVARIRPAANPRSTQVMLLLHGWTGDETVMWVFARSLPADAWIIAPRGPIQAPSGYGWAKLEGGTRQDYQAYHVSGAGLMRQVEFWRQYFQIPAAPLDVMGFSQGAALGYVLLADYPNQIHRLIALGGFMPESTEPHLDAVELQGKEIFIAHGSQDRTVPVQAAVNARDTLIHYGALVRYCEDAVGHKLGAGCNKEMNAFLGGELPSARQ